ncbi:MAG: PBP1A family penicillin-binding protein [Coriobacteriia bacterium]|nr:PBP1A family penicillin-binding protein [Coriobacteriia bacterium]
MWRTSLVVLLLLLVAGGIAGCIAYDQLTQDLPDLSAGTAPLAETSVMYDRNGDVLVELHAEQNRTYVPLASIPLQLRQAVISTEDQNFYEHKGVDPFGIARALWVNVTQGKRHGGSTITQQYVVNTFIEREDTLTRKIKEAILAYQLESQFSKDEILEKYLNAIYFGHGAYGVQAAANTYFGKDLGQLTTAECAMIAGVLRSPGNYSPRNDPEAAKNRRDTVLGQMLALGHLDQATHDAAVAEPFTLAPPVTEATVAPYFVEWVKQTVIDQFGPDAVYKGGLHIHTTIDPAAQAAAENAIASVLDQPDDPTAALVSLDPRTGEVRALVGGKDFTTQQFNVAVQGPRQPGSSFKPFVLVAALEKGISPEQTYESAAGSFPIPGGQTWKVSGSSAGGPMRLRVATVKSVNSVYAQLILEVGADAVADTAKRMGIETPIKAVPAIALGSQEVTPLEMASAYGTLANAGVHVPAHGISKVVAADGETIFEAQTTGSEAISPAVAYLTTDILKGVITGGTGTAAKIGRPAAGKTGTTQEYRDAWFVGYTPELATSVWMGHVEGQIEMTDVHGKKVTGGSFPAQIWAAYMKAALANVEATDFVRPRGISSATICMETGLAASENCTTTAPALFLTSAMPEPCELHAQPSVIDVPNMIGLQKADALAQLTALGLTATVEETAVAGVPTGMIADQSPKMGTQVPPGSTIGLVVSSGPPKTEPPIAGFSYTPEAITVGIPVTFDASDSHDPDGSIVKWYWEFSTGADATALGETATYTFQNAGTFTVTLWVTDDTGLVSSLPLEVEVKQP